MAAEDKTISGDNLKSAFQKYDNSLARVASSGSYNDLSDKPTIPSEISAEKQDNYFYKIYDDGTFDCWYKATGQTFTISAASGNLYRSELKALTLPSNITDKGTTNIIHADINVAHNNYPCWGMLASLSATAANYYAMSGGSRNSSPNYTITAHLFGTIE